MVCFSTMSARKVETNLVEFYSPATRCLTLLASSVRIRKNGIEFHNETPLSPWTEMTVTLQSTRDTGRVHCNGVVVACIGSRHDGYTVSMVFTNLSRQSQARLNLLAYS